MTFTRLAMLVAGAGAFCLGGCDRTYMTPSHGKSFREVFAAQTVNPDRQTDSKAVHGLDSQEAAIISANYRKALAPKDEGGAAGTQLLMYSPRAGLREANVPPPSVPDGR